MKNKVIFFFAVVFSFCNCTAKRSDNVDDSRDCKINCEKSYSLEQLKGTKWISRVSARTDSMVRTVYEYTSTEEIVRTEYMGFPDKTSCYKSKFYLSDTIPTKYDASLAGKVDKGKFIVLWECDRVSAWEILYFTEDSLALYGKFVDDGVRRYGAGDVLLRFSRINSNKCNDKVRPSVRDNEKFEIDDKYKFTGVNP